MTSQFKIYLCDCVHNYLGTGTHMFPLNIAYVASYAKKRFPGQIEIMLFKYPMDFINQLKKETPALVGFSNYVWSADLNNQLSKRVKAVSADTVVVFGGPNINYSDYGYKRFFMTHDSVDFYIPYEGETPFASLLNQLLGSSQNLDAIRLKPIDGVISYDRNSKMLIKGKDAVRLKDPNVIPSPYLTGLLDSFFDTSLIPIMETNRGCPFTCTFCAQGMSSHNSIRFFDIGRVKEEVRYIADRMKNTNMLTLADANFGVAERDMEIARFLADTKQQMGHPRKFNINWSKNRPQIFEFAKILTNFYLVVSLQSMNETVLKNIKRNNISLSIFKDIIDKINAVGGISGVEIIWGLPGETKDSHLEAIRKLFDWNVSYIYCYNLVILEGTQMSMDKDENRLDGMVKYRLIDHSFGKYEDITSFEAEEGIRSTSALSEADMLFFRPVHWLIQFLWNFRFYFDLLKFVQSLKLNPVDYIIRLIENVDENSTPAKVREIFNEFKKEAEQEWFDSAESVRDYYSKPGRFKSLKEGRAGGKMNFKYIFRVLLEAKEPFERYLYQTAIGYSPIFYSKKDIFRDILNFLSASIIDFTKDWDEICKERSIECKYDILKWKKFWHKRPLEDFYCQEGIKYNFYLPKEQEESIKILLNQYYNKNINVTLRKMTEYMDIADLIYKIGGITKKNREGAQYVYI